MSRLPSPSFTPRLALRLPLRCSDGGIGYAPSGTAARKIHDRDVVQGHVAQQVVGTKVQAQILGGGRTHAAICIRFQVGSAMERKLALINMPVKTV